MLSVQHASGSRERRREEGQGSELSRHRQELALTLTSALTLANKLHDRERKAIKASEGDSSPMKEKPP